MGDIKQSRKKFTCTWPRRSIPLLWTKNKSSNENSCLAMASNKNIRLITPILICLNQFVAVSYSKTIIVFFDQCKVLATWEVQYSPSFLWLLKKSSHWPLKTEIIYCNCIIFTNTTKVNIYDIYKRYKYSYIVIRTSQYVEPGLQTDEYLSVQTF